jgi:hypothetical protein
MSEKIITEKDYDFIISKISDNGFTNNDNFKILFKDDYPEKRLRNIVAILIDDGVIQYINPNGYSLTPKGLKIKNDLKKLGYVALRSKAKKEKLLKTIMQVIAILTFLFVVLGFFFKK